MKLFAFKIQIKCVERTPSQISPELISFPKKVFKNKFFFAYLTRADLQGLPGPDYPPLHLAEEAVDRLLPLWDLPSLPRAVVAPANKEGQDVKVVDLAARNHGVRVAVRKVHAAPR